jgi:uncharacterized membrane protein YkvA (DUF1232 family)/GTP-binding protein EngB required for normal cell division
MPNILICGQTGVGKSSVVNYLFGEDVAATRAGEPCTKDITRYRRDDDLVIYDSEGYEIGEDRQKRYETLLFDEFLLKRPGVVDLVWYAVSGAGAKFTGLDTALVERIAKSGYPVAVLITKIDEMTAEQLSAMLAAVKSDLPGVLRFRVSIKARDLPDLAPFCDWDRLIDWSAYHAEDMDKYMKHYDKNAALKLLKKLRKATRDKPAFIAGAVGAIVTTLGKLLSALDNPETPAAMKALIMAAIGYIILPFDIIADVIPGLGFTDDLIMTSGVILMVQRYSTFSMEALDAEIDGDGRTVPLLEDN